MDVRLKVYVVGVSMVMLAGSWAKADAPSGRYVIGNGTVTDSKTKLVWQQSINGATYTRAEALAYCPTLGSGWRLPTARELITLIDFSKVDDGSAPLVSGNVFAATDWNYTGGSYYFWSSTGSNSGGWAVNFKHDFYFLITVIADAKSYARCVR